MLLTMDSVFNILVKAFEKWDEFPFLSCSSI